MAPIVVVSARHPSAGEASGPFAVLRILVSNRQIRVAMISAVCSVLLIVLMAGAAIVCADDACRGLPDPRAVLEVDDGQPDPGVGLHTGVVLVR